MDLKTKGRIQVLQAIGKAKKSGKRYIRPKRELIDTSSKHLPTKRDFQETIVNYIKTRK
jgi:hypothetical protein